MVRRLLAAVLAGCACLALAGCWDRVEIDQRGFVVGVGLDSAAPKEEEGENATKKYTGTFQIIRPSGLSTSSSASAGGQQSAYLNVQSADISMPAITARFSNIVGRSPFFEHLQLIVLSANTARTPDAITDVLDYFLRDVEMRRDIKIMISPGKASKVLGVAPFNERYPVAYLESISENSENTSYILPTTRIGDMHEYMLKQDDYAVQSIRVKDTGVTLDGAAVFEGKTNLLHGFLNGPETQGLNFLRGEIQGGILQSRFGQSTIDMEIEFAKQKIEGEIRGPRDMTFTVTIAVEGMLNHSPGNVEVDQAREIHAMQQAFEAEIKQQCDLAITKLQQQYKADVIGLGAWLRRNRNGLWEQIQDEWSEALFPNVEIIVNASVDLRRTGNIILTE